MSSPRQTHYRGRMAAHVACTACRRLKMKCVGAEQPPCVRCVKARRECTVQPGPQTGQQSQRSSKSLQESSQASGQGRQLNDGLRELPQAGQTSRHLNGSFQALPPRSHSSQHLNERFQEGPQNSRQNNIPRETSATISTPAQGMPTPPNLGPGSPQRIEGASPLPVANHQRASDLPSVYSLSPIELIESQRTGAEISTPQTVATTDRYSISTPHLSMDGDRCQDEQHSKPPDYQQLLDLVIFFNERLLHNLPFLMDDTIRDIPKLILTQRPLAYCAAFVAARFVPGYRSLREQMIPEITDILKLRHCSLKEGRDQVWTILQGFVILYAYAIYQPAVDDVCSTGEFSHWALKSGVEMFASRLALYRSAEELRTLLSIDPDKAVESIELRRYVFWLWLFTMSHHSSLLMRMPPTIGVDLNIRSAPKLLHGLALDERILRILAEVELCLLWSHVGTHDQASNEWWCSPTVPAEVKDTLATLEKFEAALETWRDRWHPTDPSNSLATRHNKPVLFHYYFTRFCISTYVTRLIYKRGNSSSRASSEGASNAVSPPIIRVVLRSIEAAVDCCTVFPTLSPLQRDRARYIADAGFSMVAFPCFYIISAAELLFGTDISMENQLQNVKRVAGLMIELGVDDSHGCKVYGKRILAKLSASPSGKSTVHGPYQPLEQQNAPRGDFSTSGMDLGGGSMDVRQHSNLASTGVQNQIVNSHDYDPSSQQPQFGTSDDWSFLDANLEAAAYDMFAFDTAWAF